MASDAPLSEYVLIAQQHPHVESYRRQPDHRWVLTESDGLDGRLRLDAIDFGGGCIQNRPSDVYLGNPA